MVHHSLHQMHLMEVHSKNILILITKTLTEMWGFFYFTICNYMLYWKLNLIKFGRVDIGELFWDSNNQPLRGNAEFWSNYQIGKNQLLDFLKDYKDYEVCCYENVEGTDMR